MFSVLNLLSRVNDFDKIFHGGLRLWHCSVPLLSGSSCCSNGEYKQNDLQMFKTNVLQQFSTWRWYKVECHSGRRFTRSSLEKNKPQVLWFCELNASHRCLTADLQEHREKLFVFVSFLRCGLLRCRYRVFKKAKPVRMLTIFVAPAASADSLLLWT